MFVPASQWDDRLDPTNLALRPLYCVIHFQATPCFLNPRGLDKDLLSLKGTLHFIGARAPTPKEKNETFPLSSKYPKQ